MRSPSAAGVSADRVAVRFEHATFALPTDQCHRRASGWTTDLSFADLAASASRDVSGAERVVMQEVEERLHVGKRTVETGRVRLTKRVETREEALSVPLLREEVEVERVTVGDYVDEAPPIRTEGGVTVIPVVEEVLVVEKRLLLREELRVTRRRSEQVEERTETLRSEAIDVERVAPPDAPGNRDG